MKTLTHGELVALIQAIQGTTFAGIETLTDARAKKTGNKYGEIRKLCRSVVSIGADYQTGVNNEAMRQGNKSPDFVAEPLPYGEWLSYGKLIQHKGEIQIRTQTAPGQRARQGAKVLGYFDSKGNKLSFDDVKQFLPAPVSSNRQSEVLSPDVKKQIYPRNYKLESILKIRVYGQTYRVKN